MSFQLQWKKVKSLSYNMKRIQNIQGLLRNAGELKKSGNLI